MRLVWTLATVFFVLASQACGSKAHSPKSALREYSLALRRGDSGTAYKLMSAQYRAKHSQKEFAAMLKRNERERKETADKIGDSNLQMKLRADLEYGLGDRLTLIREGSAWRLSSNPVDFYVQKTPEECVRSFLRAYRYQRWDVMLGFVPKAYREKMDVAMIKLQFDGPRKAEIQKMMETIEVNLNAPIRREVRENQVWLRYGDSLEIELLKEEGLWRVQQL